jgi:hypothetical protein
MGFVVDKVALEQVLSEYFGFPCQSSFHQLLHSHPHLSSGAGTIGQKWPQYKGLSPTPLALKKIGATKLISDVRGKQNEWRDECRKYERKIPFDRHRSKWEDHLKTYPNKTGCEDMNRIQVAKDRVQ